MLDIMLKLQEYVPKEDSVKYHQIVSTGECVSVHNTRYHRILFGGDQLTCQRARGVQKAMKNADMPKLKCEGMLPVAEDWHTKLCLIGVSLYVHCLSMINLFIPSSLHHFVSVI